MAVAGELARKEKKLDSDDEDSDDEPAPPPGASDERTLRSRARLRHHLEILLSSSDVTALKESMSFLEQVSVKPPTRKVYMEMMVEFLKFCDARTP